MLRVSSITKYEVEVRMALQKLFNVCKLNMLHSGDLLLCQQNGTIDNEGRVRIGLGRTGIQSYQRINSIRSRGLRNKTDDEDYFTTLDPMNFHGTTEFEYSLQEEKSNYLAIWENVYFLRTLTQIVNVVNGTPYDWHLDILKLSTSGRNKHIRENIIKRLDSVPKFQEAIKIGYDRNIRNAIAHSQYHCVQGGISYDNYGSDEYATLQGISFEGWERKYIYTYYIFTGIFDVLNQVKNEFYLPMSKITLGQGIPVRIPNDDDTYYHEYLYPNEKGDIWRFVKTV